MREGDDVTSCLVLATLADPHNETRGCETAKHLLHLHDAVQDAFKFVRHHKKGQIIIRDFVEI